MQRPHTNQIFYKFVGTWKLVERIETDSKGAISYPWGKDAIGYLIYTVETIMAVQIMPKNRELLHKNDTTQEASREGQVIAKDYIAYFGHFEIDETNQTVIHTLEGNLNPNFIGKKKIRTYNFYDDKLSLTPQEQPTLKIVWQKLSSNIKIYSLLFFFLL